MHTMCVCVREREKERACVRCVCVCARVRVRVRVRVRARTQGGAMGIAAHRNPALHVASHSQSFAPQSRVVQAQMWRDSPSCIRHRPGRRHHAIIVTHIKSNIITISRNTKYRMALHFRRSRGNNSNTGVRSHRDTIITAAIATTTEGGGNTTD